MDQFTSRINFRRGLRLLLFSIVIAFSSCKDNALIGTNIFPFSDGIAGIFTDTLTLTSQTVREDSLKTSSTLQNLVGSIDDPVFGKSFAGVYTQFRLPSNDINLGNSDTLFLDSLVLALDYNGFYGNEAAPMSVKVFQMTEDMSPDADYFSDKTFSVDPVSVGERINFVPNLRKETIVQNDTLDPHMRIRLSDRLGKWLLKQSGQAGFANNANFQNIFKGLYIAADTSAGYGNGIAYLSLSSAISRLTIFYHTPHRSFLKLHLLIGAEAAGSNFYLHHFGATPAGLSLQNPGVSDSINYVQSMGGIKTKIRIPYLKNLGRVMINKAEIEITEIIDPNHLDDTLYTVPAKIIVARADSKGLNAITPDQTQTLLVFGGDKKTELNDLGQTVFRYRISIASQVQNLIDDATDDYGLYVIIFRSPEIADRVVIGGANRNDDSRLKLNLIYTKLE